MGKSRVEAFSDGVIAVIITIMVLEMKPPHGAEFGALVPIWPKFVSYVLSFIYVGIYWNNHHHLWHAVHKVDGRVMWANLHLLFWLSLFPFMTGWVGENHFETTPVALYGVVLFMAAVAHTILSRSLIALHGNESVLAAAIGSDIKGYLSLRSMPRGSPCRSGAASRDLRFIRLLRRCGSFPTGGSNGI